jgi:hypothetical protein
MTSETADLEAKLLALRPGALDDDLLARLEACAADTLSELSPAELRFESELRATRPSALSPEMLASFENILRKAPFPTELEKIVPFPKIPLAPASPRKQPLWAAAAAVAVIGALSALMIPASKKTQEVAQKSPAIAAPSPVATPGDFVPATFNRGLSEVHDEGIIWRNNSQPHSLVRVVYKDQVTLSDANGRTLLVEQPRVEYMLVPAKTE